MAKKRPTIGILLGENNSDYLLELAQGLDMAGETEDVNLVFMKEPQYAYYQSAHTDLFSDSYNYQFRTIYEYIRFVHPDVLIVAYGSMTSLRGFSTPDDFLKQFSDIPLLLIEDVTELPGVPYLTTDNYGGMRAVTEHLVSVHNCRHIGFLAGPYINRDSNERLRAYRDVLKEHGIPYRQEYIQYGDYSDQVVPQVEALLDLEDHLDALICANDNMARAVYDVCEKRNIVVGKDLLITGYDDSQLSHNMNPELTSVEHSGLLFAHHAIRAAVQIANGQKPELTTIPAHFIPRGSCGCDAANMELEDYSTESIHKYIANNMDRLINELYAGLPAGGDRAEFTNDLIDMVQYIDHVVRSDNADFVDGTQARLKKVFSHRLLRQDLLAHYVTRVMYEATTWTEDDHLRSRLLAVYSLTQNQITYMDVRRYEERSEKLERRTWFLGTFTKGFSSVTSSFRDNMTLLMQRMQAIGGIPSAYVFFFDQKVSHLPDRPLRLPPYLYLAAHYDENGVTAYEENEWKPISTSDGFNSLLPTDATHRYYGYLLFAGDSQYGIMFCENRPEDSGFMLNCAAQLGNLFQYLTIENLQQQAMQQIEEQNQILDVLSHRDELTGLYNRRGFIEEVNHQVSANIGRPFVLMFGDLDHLKEINDTFGHSEGDFAITKVADYLLTCAPAGSIIGRVGGDEFAMLCQDSSEDRFRRKLNEYINSYNAKSDKPYYIEMSAGLYEFISTPSIQIEPLMKQADEILYKEKAKRRPSSIR